jgi:uncharacterized protein (TIGR02246 family)
VSTTDAEAIIELDRRRVDACNARDPAAMRVLFADDYVHIHTGGHRDTADQIVAHATKGDRTLAPRTLDVRVYGDCAIAIGPQVMTVQTPDGERVVHMLCTQVAHRFADGWKFVSLHSCAIAA